MTSARSDLTRFLDIDFRPNAEVIELSSVHISQTKKLVQVSGHLGSIENERGTGFVGFAGVSIPYNSTSFFNNNEEVLSFTITNLSLEQVQNPTLTIQIVDQDDKSYAIDLTNIEVGIPLELPLNSFLLSSRGRIFDDIPYNQTPLKQVRIFFKRSTNAQDTSTRLKFAIDLIF